MAIADFRVGRCRRQIELVAAVEPARQCRGRIAIADQRRPDELPIADRGTHEVYPYETLGIAGWHEVGPPRPSPYRFVD